MNTGTVLKLTMGISYVCIVASGIATPALQMTRAYPAFYFFMPLFVIPFHYLLVIFAFDWHNLGKDSPFLLWRTAWHMAVLGLILICAGAVSVNIVAVYANLDTTPIFTGIALFPPLVLGGIGKISQGEKAGLHAIEKFGDGFGLLIAPLFLAQGVLWLLGLTNIASYVFLANGAVCTAWAWLELLGLMMRKP